MIRLIVITTQISYYPTQALATLLRSCGGNVSLLYIMNVSSCDTTGALVDAIQRMEVPYVPSPTIKFLDRIFVRSFHDTCSARAVSTNTSWQRDQ